MSHKTLSHFALCLCLALPCGALFADGVTRTLEPVSGGCRVTLAWELSGSVESDLIIEERLPRGWLVDDATVPFGSLDASWFSGSVARFAVKPVLLAQPGSISFTVVAGEGIISGAVVGDWKMYIGGALRKGVVAGANGLAVLSSVSSGASGSSSSSGASVADSTATTIAVKSFKMVDGGFELSYSDQAASGTLVVEGCETLGGGWAEIKRSAVLPGDDKVMLNPGEVGACRFFRLKFYTEAK